MSIFWCKNVFPAPGMKCCCLQKKNMCNHSGFYLGLSGHYMTFRNYIAASARKRGLPRPKVLHEIWKFIPITHSIIYHHQSQKDFEGPKSPIGSNDKVFFSALRDGVLFRILSYKVLLRILRVSVLFRVISDRVLFRALSDRVFFKVLSGRAVFNVLLMTFVLFYIIFSKRRSHLRISLKCINNRNKTDSEKHNEILLW